MSATRLASGEQLVDEDGAHIGLEVHVRLPECKYAHARRCRGSDAGQGQQRLLITRDHAIVHGDDFLGTALEVEGAPVVPHPLP